VPDSIYRLRDRDLLVACVIGLIGLGVVMVQSAAFNIAAAGETLPDLWSWTGRGTRHALFAALAVLTLVTASRLDYRRLTHDNAFRSPATWLFGLAGLLCVAVLIPGIGAEVNGARRWLVIGPLRVQPSELAKWATVLLLADRLARPDASSLRGFLIASAATGLACLLVVIEDFGTAALIGGAAFCLLLAGPTRWRHLLIACPPAIVAACWFVYAEPYRWRRITAFLDPWAVPETDGYHVIQSLYSFATGGWLGTGLGNGVQKLGYLPEDTTDFIFAVICEELGVFGAGLVAVGYLTVLAVGYAGAMRCGTGFGRLLAFGIAAMLGLQAAINIAVATASVPTKGMPLPLVSAGGSGLVATAFMLGLLYSICRDDPPQVSDESDFDAVNPLAEEYSDVEAGAAAVDAGRQG
jgi:cell division protein FtsW